MTLFILSIFSMSYFNKKEQSVTTNLAGGIGFKPSKELELAAVLLTTLGSDKYYMSKEELFDQLDRLISECDNLFCAKAIVFARKQFGMRTISHYATSVLAKYISGEVWAKNFYNAVVNRPDDMTEIVACHLSRKQKITNAMRKGFAEALGRFDGYALAKYRCENNEVKLVDVVNICHPKETEKNAGAITKLIHGELKSFDTWESELSAVGDDVDAKKSVWRRLLAENKLGYFALLRNIRNIITLGDPNLKNDVLTALLNEDAIRKSLVLPFRFSTAYKELAKIDADAMRQISRACEIACSNVPKLPGKTLVALDVSGSMSFVADVASLFAAVLVKSNDCDIIRFSEAAEYMNVNSDDSIMTIKECLRFAGGGTNFIDIFNVADKKYDRVILLSDMQAWMDRYVSPSAAYNDYKRKFNPDCKMYSIDLSGYGTLQLPEKNTYCLAGFSEKIFDIMKYFEDDKDALLTVIKAVEL